VSGSSAAGTGFVTVARVAPDVLRLDGQFIVEGTTGPVTMAHLHRGQIGVNGDIALALLPRADSLREQWVFGDTMALAVEDLTLLRNSSLYVNFHTDMYSAGEARGQLVASAANVVPTASSVPERTLAENDPVSVNG